MSILKTLLAMFAVLYLVVGACFAFMPLMFGAWKVAITMLFAWPLIFTQ